MSTRHKKYTAVIIAGFIAAASVFMISRGSWAGPDNALPASGPAVNVILIVVDCLRADHLSCYGYNRNTSPCIDEFAAESAVFTDAVSQASNTAMSFASLFTSQYVGTHGLTSIDKRLGDSSLTLALILNIYGYRTAAFVGAPLLDPGYGLNRGFEVYDHDVSLDVSFRDTAPKAVRWMEAQASSGQKFFLVLHGNELHVPYDRDLESRFADAGTSGQERRFLDDRDVFLIFDGKIMLPDAEPVALSDRDMSLIVDLYDEQIARADGVIGDFLSSVRRLGLMSNTVIILTADHGEGLFDHEFFFHDHSLYENTVRVPLIIRLPGRASAAGERLSLVRLIDLAPTVLDILGIPGNRFFEGESIAGQLVGTGHARSAEYAFSQTPHGDMSIRDSRWKLIAYADTVRLFDIKRDPAERHDLSRKDPRRVARMRQAYEAYVRRHRGLSGEGRDISEGDVSEHRFSAIKARQAHRKFFFDALAGKDLMEQEP